MSTFEELLGATLKVAATAERAAAVGAYLRMLDGEDVDPSVSPTLAAIGRAALPGAEELPPEQRQALTGALVAFLRQAADLLEEPGRRPGWTYSDPVILQAQGRLSMTLAPVLGAAAQDLSDLGTRLAAGGTFCDVGTGVGWLAIGAAGVWPQAKIIGIDVHRPALEIAATNVTEAGLDDQIELRLQDVRDLPPGESDLIWLPGPFLPGDIISDALAASYASLRPGGWLAFGLYGGPDDAESASMAALRTLRSGGWPANAEQVMARLETAGFVETHQVPRTWHAPVRLVVGLRP